MGMRSTANTVRAPLLLAAAIAAALPHAQAKPASAASDCAMPIRTAADAMSKADWVIEGTVSTMNVKGRTEIILNQTRGLYQKGAERVHATNSLGTAPCFPGGTRSLDGKVGMALDGKRMRFYGNTHDTSPSHRFFFMEPAANPLPDLEKKKAADSALARLQTAGVRQGAENPLGDGWHRAHSTLGGFAVDLPGPFDEATRVSDGHPGFMLRAQDRFGSTFIVVFEPSGPGSPMGATIDHSLESPGSTTASFRGFPALVTTRSPIPQKQGMLINHSLMFRVPGGSYMIGIVTSPEHEAESMRDKERFYNSLTFDM